MRQRERRVIVQPLASRVWPCIKIRKPDWCASLRLPKSRLSEEIRVSTVAWIGIFFDTGVVCEFWDAVHAALVQRDRRDRIPQQKRRSVSGGKIRRKGCSNVSGRWSWATRNLCASLGGLNRHSHCFSPLIGMTTSSKCHLSTAFGRLRLMQSAKWRPNRFTHNRTASRLTSTRRAANRSSTSAVLYANLCHAQIAYEITSRGRR